MIWDIAGKFLLCALERFEEIIFQVSGTGLVDVWRAIPYTSQPSVAQTYLGPNLGI